MTSTFTYNTIVAEFILRIAAASQLITTVWFIFIWLKLRKPLAMKKFYAPSR
jgi:hypothetical protein